MGASPACANILPPDAVAASGLTKACGRLLRELCGRVAAATTIASAVRLLIGSSTQSGPDRTQLLALRGETNRLLHALDALLFETHDSAANSLISHRPSSSLSALFERLSRSTSIQLNFPSGLAQSSQELPLMQVPCSEAIVEQILIHLVRSTQLNPVYPVTVEAYLDSHQARQSGQPGRPAQPVRPGESDLCFEVISGFSLPPCAESELECARALALSIGAELSSGEYARRGHAAALKLRIPVWGLSAHTKSLRLLLVDDRRINQLVLADEFSACGHAVAVAGNAPEVMGLLGHHTFDAVLTDLNMPGMDGLDLARAIRASRAPTSELPVVLLVPQESPAILEQARIAGVNAVARKYAGAENILHILAGHLPGDQRWDYMPACEWNVTVH